MPPFYKESSLRLTPRVPGRVRFRAGLPGFGAASVTQVTLQPTDTTHQPPTLDQGNQGLHKRGCPVLNPEGPSPPWGTVLTFSRGPTLGLGSEFNEKRELAFVYCFVSIVFGQCPQNEKEEAYYTYDFSFLS